MKTLDEIITNKDLLQYALENGIIDRGDIEEQIKMQKKQKYLSMHKFKIWQGKSNGYYYTYLPDPDQKRKLIKRKTEKQLQENIIDFYRQEEDNPRLKTVFYRWLDSKNKYGEIQPQTIERYKTDFTRFFKGQSIARMRFQNITENILEDFIKSTIHDQELTSKAWSGLRLIINGMFKFAKKQGYTEISITNFMGDLDLSPKIFAKHTKKDSQLVFNDLEIFRIENYIKEKKPSVCRLGLLLIFQTGLRIGEISALKWEDIGEDSIFIHRTEIRLRRNNKISYEVRDYPKTDAGIRKVVLTTKAKEIIEKIRELNHSDDYVFANTKRLRSGRFTEELYYICDSLQIPKRSAHKVRMTYATKLINKQVPESIIINQMGHTDIKTTREYYYHNNKSLSEMAEILNQAL